MRGSNKNSMSQMTKKYTEAILNYYISLFHYSQRVTGVGGMHF